MSDRSVISAREYKGWMTGDARGYVAPPHHPALADWEADDAEGLEADDE